MLFLACSFHRVLNYQAAFNFYSRCFRIYDLYITMFGVLSFLQIQTPPYLDLGRENLWCRRSIDHILYPAKKGSNDSHERTNIQSSDSLAGVRVDTGGESLGRWRERERSRNNNTIHYKLIFRTRPKEFVFITYTVAERLDQSPALSCKK